MLHGVQWSQSLYFLKFFYLKTLPFIKENFKFILFPYVQEALSCPNKPDMDPH